MQSLAELEYDQAIATFNQLLAINPRHLDALKKLAYTLRITQRPGMALTVYRRALRFWPNHPDFLNGMGHCFRAMGDFTKAMSFYKKALRIAPDNVRSLYCLAFACDNSDAEVVRRLHRLYQSPDCSGKSRVMICFALGKVHENQGQYHRAFQYYDEANRLQFSLVPYDEVDRLDTFDLLQSSFDGKLLARLRNAGCSDTTPIFVLGMPRSGSSLVEQILASHSKVYGAGEVDIIPYICQHLVPRLTGQPFPHAANSSGEESVVQLAEHYLRQLRGYCPDKGLHIVDKTTVNFFHIEMIRILFPHAPIIHCVRDPMDTCWSIFKGHFSGAAHAYGYNQGTLGRYYRRYQKLMQHWHWVLPGEILDVHYELLVAQPEYVIRSLLDYCRLPWEENCLAFYRTKRVVNTLSARQVRRPIYTIAIKSWEPLAEELTPLRVALQA